MHSFTATRSILVLGLALLTWSCQSPEGEVLGPLGKNGMVVSAHPEATQIGLKSYPAAGNIGGGGFWIVRDKKGEEFALDYREKAPLRSHRDMFLDSSAQVMEGASTDTPLASGVPGTVDGMVKAHEKFGLLSWEALVQPAVDLAEKGFPVTEQQARSLNGMQKSLVERNPNPTAFHHALRWEKGDTLKQPELAATLARIRDHGRDGFYSGETAEMIVDHMTKNGGLISFEDLSSYQAQWRQPIQGSYRDFRFISMPPPSSGGVALSQLLGIMEHFSLEESGHNTAATIHLMVEAEKRVYADRSEYLGDPDFFAVPVDSLLDATYLKKRASEINPAQATPAHLIHHGDFILQESSETTHYSVADKWGNAVAATTTLNGGYGSRIVVEKAGFFLNNEMDDFSIKPGFANMYGLIGGEANSIQPGKRMLSSMTPTIVTKNGKLFLVVGSPGGSTIITSVFQTILNVTDHHMTMQEAVNAGRFHHQWLPDYIRCEDQVFTEQTKAELEQKGHQLRYLGSIGRVDAILRWKNGMYEGGADPRGDDSAMGY